MCGESFWYFRDSFVNIIELDDLFQRAADAEEPEDKTLSVNIPLAAASRIENSAARLFSNPAGDFGSMVNERVVDGSWESGDELGDTWRSRKCV